MDDYFYSLEFLLIRFAEYAAYYEQGFSAIVAAGAALADENNQ